MQKRNSLLGISLSFALLGLIIIAWFQRQAIFDQIRLHNYNPPTSIIQLATSTTMNDKTRRLFYVYHPELDSREEFSDHCPNRQEKSIVLGCYVSPYGIYLFDVSDERLAGIEEVTAAHEILHAAYDRLSSGEKKEIDQLLNQAFSEITDNRIKATIESYSAAGADINNELHSILGTEVRNLPTELETYYSRYFNNRKKIVSFSEQYEKAFSDRKAQADSFLKRMEEIEGQLQTLRNEIDASESSLTNQRQVLEQERRTTQDANTFNTKVGAYNNQVTIYQAKIQTYNSLVSEHNDILKKYNAIALEESELIKAIDSRPSTIQSQ